MDTEKKELYEILNKTKEDEDYIPVIESVKDFYIILGDKVARSTRETHRRYLSYLESTDKDTKKERFNTLSETVELASEKNKGIWFALEGFIDKLGKKDMELIKKSLEVYQ